MSLKTFKPYTKSTRGTILVDRSNLWKGKPLKYLVTTKYSSKGRNKGNKRRRSTRKVSGGAIV